MEQFLRVFYLLLMVAVHAFGDSVANEPTIEDEIAEWRRRGLPEVVEIVAPQNKTNQVHLLAEADNQLFQTSNITENVKYYLFTRENPSSGVQFSRDVDEIQAAGFNAKRPTKIVVHGFTCNIECNIFKRIVPNLLQEGDYNVIGVDWGSLCHNPLLYINARNNVPRVGEEVALTVDFLVEECGLELEDLHLMGHSLGAHVVGNIGKNVKSGKVPRISGLDPAGPLFLLTWKDRLAPSDAKLVDVVHTCAGLMGYPGDLGTVDFYVNGGSNPQPGCGLDLLGVCSHERAMETFAESILEPGSFPAAKCASTAQAKWRKCPSGRAGAVANMGFHLKFSQPGPYAVETESSAPYDSSYHSKQDS